MGAGRLDWRLGMTESHLRNVLRGFVTQDNERCSHHGLKQLCPVPRLTEGADGPITSDDVLDDAVHDYYGETA